MSRALRLAFAAFALMLVAHLPARAQALVIGVAGGPVSLDPHASSAPQHIEALRHVYDTLLAAGEDLQPGPGLADGWRSAGPTTWEFKLRSGVRFQDGSPLRAEDVTFSIARTRDAALENNPARGIRSTRIVAPNLVHVETDAPDPALPGRFTRLFIVSEALTTAQPPESRRAAFDSGRIAIGTGPYRIASWRAGVETVLERFSGYWGDKPAWDLHVRREFASPDARIAALKEPGLDLVADIPADRQDEVRAISGVALLTADLSRFLTLEIDLRDAPKGIGARDGSTMPKNPFKDHRVRLATDLALDRQTLADTVLSGLGKPANQLATRTTIGFSRSIPPRIFNAGAARKLLAEAGYPEGLRVELTAPRAIGAAGEAIARMLTTAGFEATATIVPDDVFEAGQVRGDFGLAILRWTVAGGDVFATLAALAHSRSGPAGFGARNALGYANARLDRMIESAASEFDPDLRRGLIEQAHALYLRDFQRLPLVSLGQAWAVRKDRVTLTPRADGETRAMSIKPAK